MRLGISRSLVAVVALSAAAVPTLAAQPAQAVGPQGLEIQYVNRFVEQDLPRNQVAPGEWVSETVTVRWSCRWEDGHTYDITKEVSTEGTDQTATATCEQPDGNSVSDTQGGINIDYTAPEIEFLGRTSPNAADWNKGPVTVRWTCTDDRSGAESGTVSTTLTKDGPGQTATGTCRDLAGNTTSADRGNINIDTVAPYAEMTDRTPANAAGWNNTPVTVAWTCLDEESGPAYDDTSASLTKDGESDATGTCKDKAGNVSHPSEPVKLDTVAPSITLTDRTKRTDAGWNNTDVDLHWTCADATSGPTAAGADATVSTAGANQSATGTCTDVAGNTSSDTVDDVSIDLTDPTVEWDATSPQDGASYFFGFAPKPSCFSGDTLSGNGPCAVTDDSKGVGTHTLTATATDLAGNQATDTRSFDVKAWRADGFIGAVTMRKVAPRSKHALRFAVFAGSKQLTSPGLVDTHFLQRRISCSTGQAITPGRAVDLGLRTTYNAKTRAFNATWQAPSRSGCYAVRGLLADGSGMYTKFQVR